MKLGTLSAEEAFEIIQSLKESEPDKSAPGKSAFCQKIRPVLVALDSPQLPKILWKLAQQNILRRERGLGFAEKALGYSPGTFPTAIITNLWQPRLKLLRLEKVSFEGKYSAVWDPVAEAIIRDIWRVALTLAESNLVDAPKKLQTRHIVRAIQMVEEAQGLGLEWVSRSTLNAAKRKERARAIARQGEKRALNRELRILRAERDQLILKLKASNPDSVDVAQMQTELNAFRRLFSRGEIRQALCMIFRQELPPEIALTAAKMMTHDPSSALRYLELYR